MIQTLSIITLFLVVVVSLFVGKFILTRLFSELRDKINNLEAKHGTFAQTVAEFSGRLEAAIKASPEEAHKKFYNIIADSDYQRKLLENKIAALTQRVEDMSAREARRARDERRRAKRDDKDSIDDDDEPETLPAKNRNKIPSPEDLEQMRMFAPPGFDNRHKEPEKPGRKFGSFK
jgi:hypothetical protein